MGQLRDAEGRPLLMMRDIERLTGWSHETVKHYSTAANKAREWGYVTAKHMPKAAGRMKVTMPKPTGGTVTVWTSVWLESDIMPWLRERGVIS